MNIKQARSWVPVLGLLALVVMFLNLPGAPNVFAVVGCKTCSASDPYLPLIGGGYFATLVALALLFPEFPGPLVARGGLTWALLLAAALTYLKWPGVCVVCLIGHACHVVMWLLWQTAPAAGPGTPGLPQRERLYLTLVAPIAVVALFSSLNLTFQVYGFKVPTVSPTTMQAGDAIPAFTIQTSEGRSLSDSDAAQSVGMVINFVSPTCDFCEKQLPILDAVATKLATGSYRFVNVSSTLPPELVQRAPRAEWAEDKENKLREQFHVSGTPTLFVIGTDGKIARILAGVPDELEAQLLTCLVKPPPGEQR